MSSDSGAAAERVAALPRRTAHALHALVHLASNGKREGFSDGGPHRASEILLYDEESLSVQETAAALREAARRGLAVHIPPSYWTPSESARVLGRELEDRYLRETGEPS